MWALASEDDLSRSVSRFLAGPRKWRYPQAPDEIRDRTEAFLGDPKGSAQLVRNADAMARLMRQSRILHHQAAGGYLGESADRNQATWRILDMIEKLEIDPHQLIAAIKGRGNLPPTGASAAHLPVAATPLLPLPFADSEDGKPGLISIWAKESNPQAKTVYSWGRIMKKLTTFVGFDDVARLTAEQLIDWKDELVNKSNLHPNTIENHLYFSRPCSITPTAIRRSRPILLPKSSIGPRPIREPSASAIQTSRHGASSTLHEGRPSHI
jgi:hypothetical protein